MATGKLLRQLIKSGIEGNMQAFRSARTIDTSAWEREIDDRVYRLYGLRADEIKSIEASKPCSQE
jgi:hypothetical protein